MLKQLVLPFTSYKYLLVQLILREIKARYKQSIIGYAWVIINPLTQLLVYSFVFSVIFRFPTNDIPYPVFLFVGLLPWIYFQNTITTAALCLVDNSDLIRKVNFPREVFPYAVISAKAIDLFFACIILVLFMIFYQVPFSPTTFFLIPLFLIQVLLMTGVSLLISAFNLFFRDIQYVINLVLMVWLYFTPVIYPLSLVPSQYVALYKLNPMVGIIEGYRSAIFNTPFDTGMIAWSALVSFALLVLAFHIFKKLEKVFADIV